jgi:glucose-6-phosphate dehydrogenase assembly protein OpcA
VVETQRTRRANATRRLTARAASVSGVEAALGRIWAQLSGEVATARSTEGSMVPLARTRVLTLVVVASNPETTERAMDTILKLAGRHPSRTIVLGFGDPDGPPRIDAEVQALCHPFGDSNEVCTEQIVVRLAGEACQHPVAVAAPLLLHDLPVAVWWTDDPLIGGPSFGDIVGLADRLIVDSSLFRDDGRARLVGLAAQARRALEIHDLGWMRLELWRTLLAGLFDDPALAPFLGAVSSVRLSVARPGTVVRLTRAALYLGWLASRLGWRVVTPLQAGRGGTLRGALTVDGARIAVEVVPEEVGDGRRPRTPGGLVRLELTANLGRQRAEVVVARADGHVGAEARIDGHLRATRAATLERHEDMPYLAAALEASGPDEIFQAALPVAAELLAARG